MLKDETTIAEAERAIDNNETISIAEKDLGTEQDRKDMRILGKSQQLRRNFSLVPMLGFSSTAVISWEIVPVFLVWNLIDGGTPIVFWGLLVYVVGMILVYASMAEMASMCPTAGGEGELSRDFSRRPLTVYCRSISRMYQLAITHRFESVLTTTVVGI